MESYEQRLQRALSGWLSRAGNWAWTTDAATYSLTMRTAEDVAKQLLADTEFNEVRLAAFLRSPDGEIVRAVVMRILPAPQRQLAGLLVQAILIAADARTQRDQVVAGLATIAALTIIAGLFGSP